MPPAIKRISLPSRASSGKPLPKGPRMPTIAPFFRACRALVTLPTFLTASWKVPSLVGDDEMEMGASPMPMTETSTNCPGRCPRLLPSLNLNSKTFSRGVNSSTLTSSAGRGAYSSVSGLTSLTMRLAASLILADSAMALKASSGLAISARQAMAHRPQPTQPTLPYLSRIYFPLR